jgi:shikimate kinase
VDVQHDSEAISRIVARLGGRNIVLVGMMGAGKTSVGRRLAQALNLPFVDADSEIEAAARMTIPDIFQTYGETHFRDGERRVILRLLSAGPSVIATGGGAFMCDETRASIQQNGISVWLKAELAVLVDRVTRKSNRPLLKNGEPAEVMGEILAAREPVYALADIVVETREAPHRCVVAELIAALDAHVAREVRP